MRYKIILFNAGKRVRTLNTFRKFSEANQFYQLNLVNNKVLFPKLRSWKGAETDFELVLLGPPEGKGIEFVRDNEGRKINLIAPENYTIKKIEPYYVEETFLHKNKDQKYQFKGFAKNFLVKNNLPKVFLSVSNKLIIDGMDQDHLELFILKNEEDSVRLNDTIRDFCYANNIFDNLFFPKTTIEIRKQLYDRLVDQLGVSRDYLQKISTR